MISKEEFLKAIEKFKEKRAYEDNFDEHMGKAMPEHK